VTLRTSCLIKYLPLSAFCVAVQLLSGCASQTAMLSGYTKAETAATFKIVDSRPASERESKMGSLVMTSCNYGVRQVGDKNTTPDRVTLLSEDLNAAMGQQLAGKSLVLKHYSVHLNNTNVIRSRLGMAAPGLLVEMAKDAGSRCKREEMDGGWYQPDDVTTPYSPFIVEVTLLVDGRTHAVRSVYSPDKEVTMEYGKPESAAALFSAMRQAHEKVIASLGRT
jgi:hypothetical protein